jgi:hypothetical protein
MIRLYAIKQTVEHTVNLTAGLMSNAEIAALSLAGLGADGVRSETRTADRDQSNRLMMNWSDVRVSGSGAACRPARRSVECALLGVQERRGSDMLRRTFGHKACSHQALSGPLGCRRR